MNYVLFVMNNDTKQLEALACHPDKGEINGELLKWFRCNLVLTGRGFYELLESFDISLWLDGKRQELKWSLFLVLEILRADLPFRFKHLVYDY